MEVDLNKFYHPQVVVLPFFSTFTFLNIAVLSKSKLLCIPRPHILWTSSPVSLPLPPSNSWFLSWSHQLWIQWFFSSLVPSFNSYTLARNLTVHQHSGAELHCFKTTPSAPAILYVKSQFIIHFVDSPSAYLTHWIMPASKPQGYP